MRIDRSQRVDKKIFLVVVFTSRVTVMKMLQDSFFVFSADDNKEQVATWVSEI